MLTDCVLVLLTGNITGMNRLKKVVAYFEEEYTGIEVRYFVGEEWTNSETRIFYL
jgi:ABC-type glycerol-3-phosphate transport system substrate-binding protein